MANLPGCNKSPALLENRLQTPTSLPSISHSFHSRVSAVCRPPPPDDLYFKLKFFFFLATVKSTFDFAGPPTFEN